MSDNPQVEQDEDPKDVYLDLYLDLLQDKEIDDRNEQEVEDDAE